MKKGIVVLFVLISGIVFAQTAQPEDSLGLPGDNLNLYAVLDVFRESATLEEFEKSLNTEDSKINNLDLNNDEKTDYIKILDSKEGESHLITLQVEVNKNEKQDVAVITVDKDANGKTKVQIVGDPELYGKDYIIEPNDDNAGKKQASSNSPGKSSKTSDTTISEDGKTVIINNTINNYYNTTDENKSQEEAKPVPPVNQWVIVHHIYSPGYVVYVSPWYWGYYPGWWNPWRPLYWHNYYWHFHHHHFHYHHYYYHSAPFYYSKSYPKYYGQRRSISNNYVERKSSGEFKKTYSRPDLGKPTVGRPNPGYKNPPKAVKPVNPQPIQKNPRPVQGKQPLNVPKQPNKSPGKTPTQKSGGAPVKRAPTNTKRG